MKINYNIESRDYINALNYELLLKHIPQESGCIKLALKWNFFRKKNKILAYPFFIGYFLLFFIKKFYKYFLKKVISIPAYYKKNDNRIIKLAFQIAGGYGDFANRVAVLNAFYVKYPQVKVDIICHSEDVINCLYSNGKFFNRAISDKKFSLYSKYYDVVFYFSNWITIELNHTGRLKKIMPELYEDLKQTESRRCEVKKYLQNHPEFDGLFAHKYWIKGFNVITAPGYFIGLDVKESDMFIKPDFLHVKEVAEILNLRDYITVHDGVGTTVQEGVSTKQWPIEYWEELVRLIKNSFPDFKIVQIGARLSRTIQGVDISLINKTDLRQAFRILSKSRLHIDGESGHVRIAYALGVKSVVIFGSSFSKYYAINANSNIIPNSCGGCAYSTLDWMSKCPRGLKEAECMASIKPEEVFKEVATNLG